MRNNKRMCALAKTSSKIKLILQRNLFVTVFNVPFKIMSLIQFNMAMHVTRVCSSQCLALIRLLRQTDWMYMHHRQYREIVSPIYNWKKR